MNRILLIVVLTVLITVYSFPQNESTDKSLLIRCDDIGMSHGVNQAAKN